MWNVQQQSEFEMYKSEMYKKIVFACVIVNGTRVLLSTKVFEDWRVSLFENLI